MALQGVCLHHDERAGVLVAVAGFMLLSCGDAVWKTGAHLWAPTALGALRYSMAAVVLGVILWVREGRAGFHVRRPLVQLMRGGSIAVATASFITAIRFMPLVEATAVLFMSPILTALIAPLALREPVTRATWIATLAGFAGVLIVLRPNVATLGAVALFPLLAALGMSLLVIGNRLASNRGSPLAMQFQVAVPGAAALILLTVAGHLSEVDFLTVDRPPAAVLVLCLAVGVIATTGHWLVYLGTTKAGAASVAPTTYAQIIVAGAIGWAVFDEPPDLTALLGIAIIAGAGLYLWHSRPPIGIPDELA